jgi:hypothetical protein
MSSPARPAPGVVIVRLMGAAADCDALAAILARQKVIEILTGPDGPYPNRRQPGSRLYLTVRLAASATNPQPQKEPIMTTSPQDPHVTPYKLVIGDGPAAGTYTGITRPAAEPEASDQPIPFTLTAEAEAVLADQAGPAAEPGPELPAADPGPQPEPEAEL